MFCCFLFLQLAKKLHPDTNKNDPEAETKFQEVSKAYEVGSVSLVPPTPNVKSILDRFLYAFVFQVLKDEDKRRLYDQVNLHVDILACQQDIIFFCRVTSKRLSLNTKETPTSTFCITNQS